LFFDAAALGKPIENLQAPRNLRLHNRIRNQELLPGSSLALSCAARKSALTGAGGTMLLINEPS
jgi:hypothetical protein